MSYIIKVITTVSSSTSIVLDYSFYCLHGGIFLYLNVEKPSPSQIHYSIIYERESYHFAICSSYCFKRCRKL